MCVYIYIYINNFAAFSFNNSLCLVVHKYDLMQTTSCKIQFLHLLLTTVISRTGSRLFAHYVLFCTRAWDISPQPDHILFAAECNLYITVLKAWKCGARISVHYLCFKSDFTHITLITTNCSKKHWCSCVWLWQEVVGHEELSCEQTLEKGKGKVEHPCAVYI